MKKLIVCILCLASTHLFAQFRLGIQGSLSSVNMWQTDQIGGLPTGAQDPAAQRAFRLACSPNMISATPAL